MSMLIKISCFVLLVKVAFALVSMLVGVIVSGAAAVLTMVVIYHLATPPRPALLVGSQSLPSRR